MLDYPSVTSLILPALKNSLFDIFSIVLVLALFWGMALRKRIGHLKRIFRGFLLVIVGLAIFIIGLEQCVFPIGTRMARQLTDIAFLSKGTQSNLGEIGKFGSNNPSLYLWTYAFAFMIGFATTLAEPALIVIAGRARELFTGAVSEWGLRIAVALGVGLGTALGCYRIITGTPLYLFLTAGYMFLLIQTLFAPKIIIPLAFDSGGVTTSTVTVPLLTALGIGLASHVPGRSPLLDGFGLIAFASLFPMITVMAYAMIGEMRAKRKNLHSNY
ncbi:MAG: DUF1538 domain-containing protein [Nitrospinaceae bacterium]